MSLVSTFWTPTSPSLCPPLLCSPFQHLLWPLIWICACPGRFKVSPGAGPPLGPGLPPSLGLCLPDSPLRGQEAGELSVQDASLVAESSRGPRVTHSCGLGRGVAASVFVGAVSKDSLHGGHCAGTRAPAPQCMQKAFSCQGCRGRHLCCCCSVGTDKGAQEGSRCLLQKCFSCPHTLSVREKCVHGACH